MSLPVKAPMPWFGGKSSAASLVWERFGNPDNYVEPFCGSAAVLLARPGGAGRVETINDADGFVANFWRAMTVAPEEVAKWADWPVNEADLHARHYWLVTRRESLTDRLMGDPDFCDAKIAGWWVWGACAWIGTGWCSGEGPWQSVDGVFVNVKDGDPGQGVNRKLPHLGDPGRGVNRKLDAPTSNRAWAHLEAVAERMRGVRVACGDWRRVLGPTVTYRHGTTAVFLDPPYNDGAMEYAIGGRGLSSEVMAWAVEEGANPMMRIAVCGYEGEHETPEGWDCVEWKARGGYANQSEDDDANNRHRERIWFSPHCLKPAQGDLFGGAA